MLAALAAITTATSTVSGQVKVDLKKFPEYSPRVKVDKHLVAKPDVKRPDYVNNAESIYFPPIISQVSNSCGSAAGIQGRRIKLNFPSTAYLSSPHSIPLSVVLG